MSVLEIAPPFRASPKQNELARAWRDPGVTRLLAAGAIRSGKTQAACRILVETALEHPAVYLVSRATYRELHDTTMRAMLHGDGPLPSLIPHAALRGQSLRSGWMASDYTAYLANGAEIVFRSLEENATEKIRGLTLAGALVDQMEELRYDEGEHLYDEILGRLSDGRGPKKLLCIANPAGMDHWLRRRFYGTKDTPPDPGSRVVHFKLTDNEANLDSDYFSSMMATKLTRPHWYRTFVLGEWGAIQDAAYILEADHLVESFSLPDAYDRFECADYGFNGAPWCLWASDFDGNLVAVDMLYARDMLPSELCPLVRAKRAGGWGEPWAAYMDPSVWHRTGTLNRWGAPAVLADEFAECGVPLVRANNDPRAGMARLRELLRLDPERPFPPWHPKRGEPGSPRVFFTRACQALVDELRSAPLQPLDKRDGGEIVDPEWESRNGHAAAMCRYAGMVKADASGVPETPLEEARRLGLRVLDRGEQMRELVSGLAVAPVAGGAGSRRFDDY